MNRGLLTHRRVMTAIALLLVVAIFMPSSFAAMLGRLPQTAMLTVLTPLTAPLKSLSDSLRGAEPSTPVWSKQEQLERDYGIALRLNDSLLQQNRLLREQLQQLARVREVVGDRPADFFSVAVTGFFDEPTNPTLALSRGSLSGIQERQPVVSGYSLVGQISEVGPTSSQVELITAPETKLQVRIIPPTPGGAMEGYETFIERHPERPEVFYVDVNRDLQLRPGDLAHLSDRRWRPEALGFVVGQITQINNHPDQPLLLRRLIIEPILPLADLSMVTVLVPAAEGSGGGS